MGLLHWQNPWEEPSDGQGLRSRFPPTSHLTGHRNCQRGPRLIGTRVSPSDHWLGSLVSQGWFLPSVPPVGQTLWHSWQPERLRWSTAPRAAQHVAGCPHWTPRPTQASVSILLSPWLRLRGSYCSWAERSFPWAGLCRQAVFYLCLSYVKSWAERKQHNPKLRGTVNSNLFLCLRTGPK